MSATPLTGEAIAVRHKVVADNVARGLDQALRDCRTHDGKQLTEGEVMSALGYLIGQHCRDADRVKVWCGSIHSTALHENEVKLKLEAQK